MEAREKIETNVRAELENQNRAQREQAYFKALLDKNDFEVPQELVDQEIRSFFYQSGLLQPNSKGRAGY